MTIDAVDVPFNNDDISIDESLFIRSTFQNNVVKVYNEEIIIAKTIGIVEHSLESLDNQSDLSQPDSVRTKGIKFNLVAYDFGEE